MFKVIDRKNLKIMYTAEDLQTAQKMLRKLVKEQEKNGVYLDTRYAITVEA